MTLNIERFVGPCCSLDEVVSLNLMRLGLGVGCWLAGEENQLYEKSGDREEKEP